VVVDHRYIRRGDLGADWAHDPVAEASDAKRMFGERISGT
jgi:hypothetical protein